jgi:HJR/Mrr/RecB family endonuclease
LGGLFNIDAKSQLDPLSINQIDNLNPYLFEAAVAAIFNKQGFQVHLTPYSNDKGVDVVLLSENDNYLFQVKQSTSLVGRDAIQEIYTAKNYYENRFNVKFKLSVLANNEYSSTALVLAASNSVNLINRNQLKDLLKENPITIKDIYKVESQRLDRI